MKERRGVMDQRTLINWAGDRVLNLQACQRFCLSAKAWERANTKLCWTHLAWLNCVWKDPIVQYVCLCRVLFFCFFFPPWMFCGSQWSGNPKQLRSSTWPRLSTKAPSHKWPCVFLNFLKPSWDGFSLAFLILQNADRSTPPEPECVLQPTQTRYIQLVGILTSSTTSCQIDISSSESRRCVLKQSPVFSSPVLRLRIKQICCSLSNHGQTLTELHTRTHTSTVYKGSQLLAYPSFTVITINWRINQLPGRDGLVRIDHLEECRFRGESALYL